MIETSRNNQLSFEGYSIVSCGTLSLELNHLKAIGFLNADKILYTKPGLHERPAELESQLKRQLLHAKRFSSRIIVVYGKRCYVDSGDYFKTIDTLIQEDGDRISRIDVSNCLDALLDDPGRERISDGKKIYWLTPGWLKYWKQIFRNWDVGLANETFPKNDKAIVLDTLNFFDECCQNHPETILEFSDWMKIPIESHKISLDRLKKLLAKQVDQQLNHCFKYLKGD